MDELTRLKAEAAAFRGLVQHLQKRTDVQNIDIMNTAGFCRNCLAKWYKAAAEHYGAPMTYDQAQEAVYGMPIGDWKSKYQKSASSEQEQKFEATKPLHAKIGVVE
ncbi:MAG: DUF1244 domain-containing protein [Rhodospirillaceae bacterium]|nr:MAG: DUF1244 domain-containing protein [Rhodospirillaceae bacterium]